MAKKDLEEMKDKKKIYENKLKIFYYQKMRMMKKMQLLRLGQALRVGSFTFLFRFI